MKKALLAAILAAMFGTAQAGGSSVTITNTNAAGAVAGSSSTTGAGVYVSGTGAGEAGAFDKSGASALNANYGRISINAAEAHSYGGSFAYGTHTGPGTTAAGAFEDSRAAAAAGSLEQHKLQFKLHFGYDNEIQPPR